MDKKIFIITAEDGIVRITRFLKKKMPLYNFNQISQLLRKGCIKLNDIRIKKDVLINVGDKVEIFAKIEEKIHKNKISPNRKLIQSIQEAIIYKDQDLIALNKPAGLATQGGTKVKISLDDLAECLTFERKNKPKLVHRLDRETSGLILLARHDIAARDLTIKFRKKEIEKYYLALVFGQLQREKGTIETITSKDNNTTSDIKAITHYEILFTQGYYHLMQFKIETGKKHQIRIHAKELGIPILGDTKYGGQEASRLFLHSHQAFFNFNNQKFSLTAEVPASFYEICTNLGIKIQLKTLA